MCPPLIAEMPQIPFFRFYQGKWRGLSAPSEHREELREVWGFPPGSCRSGRSWPHALGRPVPRGHRAQGATGTLSQGHAMTQKLLVEKPQPWCVTALMALYPPHPSPPLAGDAPGAPCVPLTFAGFVPGHRCGNLNCNPLTPGVPGEQNRLFLPAGHRPGPPRSHLFANCAGREGEGEEIQKVNCESNTAAPRAQHSNQAIKQ